MPPDKIIFDTNIFISLAINKETTLIADLNSKSGIQLIICDELIAELKEVLLRPKFSRYEIEEEAYIRLIKLFSQTHKINKRVARLPDEDDNFLVDLALSVNTDIIVTGDKILLGLKNYMNVKFISLSHFRKII